MLSIKLGDSMTKRVQLGKTHSENLGFISISEMCDAEYEFQILDINIKRDVPGKFGTSDVIYAKISITGTDCMISVRQKALFDGFMSVKADIDAGRADTDAWYIIDKPEGKSYYALFKLE